MTLKSIICGMIWMQLSCICLGQKETVLQGYLGVEGGESYTYKLVFMDSAGVIKGHSYTYLYENKEVKAAITGFIDRNNKTLSFKETNIEYNHGFESTTTICLIHATLHYKKEHDGREIYSGAITSSDISNVYCGQGTVTFPYNENLQAILSKAPELQTNMPTSPVIKPAKPIRVVYDTTTTVKHLPSKTSVPVHEPEKITAGKEKFIEWYSDSVVIEIWDGGKIDGDIISIKYNAKSVFEKLLITKDPQRKVIPVNENEMLLRITAINEGNESPNTANILLTDGTVKHSIIAYNTIGKVAVIRLRKTSK